MKLDEQSGFIEGVVAREKIMRDRMKRENVIDQDAVIDADERGEQ